MNELLSNGTFIYTLLMTVGLIAVIRFSGVIRYIPNNRIGVCEKLWSTKGSIGGGFIALKGEAGFQPKVLRGGFQFFFPFQYRIHIEPLVTIPQGKIGYIFARDGAALSATQTLASNAKNFNYEDVADFLNNGGQKGPQRKVLREGTYALNLAQFIVITSNRLYGLLLESQDHEVFERMNDLILERQGYEPIIIKDSDDLIGVVTVHDGDSLPADQIIAPKVGDDPSNVELFHNNFQDPEAFLRSGGRRGRQLQVLVEGSYYINRLFATVEMIPKSIIEVGTVGVVVSYTGEMGSDRSGDAYRHGELVEVGRRGVWEMPLLPGKYAFNTYAGNIIVVPTTNFILKWEQASAGSHNFDENLSEVSLITKDAFEPSLPLSVVVHIDYRKAPLVVQRFGDVKRLVEQTLDPMVSAYFKNIGQTRTLIQLLQDRSEIQATASEGMQEKFMHYNLSLEEVLIGTPKPGGIGNSSEQIEKILMQLRQRQIAEEQVETYNQQEKAAVKERELREAESRAKQQTSITESELSITVQLNEGKAAVARSQQEAERIKALAQAESDKISRIAEGEAKKVQLMASAEAERATRVGIAQAIAIEEQVRAYGGPKFQLTQQVMNRFSEAIENAKIDVVPKVAINGQNSPSGSGGTIMEALLTLFLSDKLGIDVSPEKSSPSQEAEAIKNELLDTIKSAPNERKAG